MGRQKKSPAVPIENYDDRDDRSLIEREEECISLALKLAEQQLRAGTASSQVITQFLKAGSARERLEQENKELENRLLEAKEEAIRTAQHREEIYAEAIAAMQTYGGSL